ncbi:PAS domain-containing protein [Salinispirillum sp. LH 10-3-1]|uniref:PAS domain-containing protein n=1 Tax=Salinispirillum sp. LH 10-3-1 TaxID=2952525 RepID=A0AB38YBR4_9GAMM
MPVTIDESKTLTELRNKAEEQLQTGTTRAGGHWSLGVDALRMLHRLSSNPDSADDALKLLHELQVHQVELDLQNEEMAANEQALVDDLNLYRDLYDSAPQGYFLIDSTGKVIQGNYAAAALLDLGRDDLAGQALDTFLLAQSRPLLLGLLKRVAHSGDRDSCVAEVMKGDKGSRYIQFSAATHPGYKHLLLACCEC